MKDVFGHLISIGDIILPEKYSSPGIVTHFSKTGLPFIRVYYWKPENNYMKLELKEKTQIVRTPYIVNITRFLKAKEQFDKE
jgi:hypothetical protein